MTYNLAILIAGGSLEKEKGGGDHTRHGEKKKMDNE